MVGIKQHMHENPQGRKCSVCGKKVPGCSKQATACVCSTCTYDHASRHGMGEEIKGKQEREETKKRKQAERQTTGVLHAAELVLANNKKGMHIKQLTEQMLADAVWTTNGATPQNTVYAAILTDMKRQGDASKFERPAPGIFRLKKK